MMIQKIELYILLMLIQHILKQIYMNLKEYIMMLIYFHLLIKGKILLFQIITFLLDLQKL
jgi:hypothetical protein